ncbi:MAG: low molecular weight phosphotyrosine protein phosphatase [Gammaproteobacteria bacterium]|nr:low molecular weight phosphotyrosine protein phosphatase [Gammaproteobacteria bacterium]
MVRVLFVCLGNICRSPTAEAVFRSLVSNQGIHTSIEVDSAGTHAYHIGEPPDTRACSAAARRGLDMSGLRARQTTTDDFHTFDYILCMDCENRQHLEQLAPLEFTHKVRLFMEFATTSDDLEVPDPYYGGAKGFERVLDMLEDAAQGLLQQIRTDHF